MPCPFPPRRAVTGFRFLRRCLSILAAAVVVTGPWAAPTPAAAQWIGYPTAGVPRKPDGTVDMTAPAPRLPGGKPDLSGIWISDRTPEGEETPSDGINLPSSRQMANIGVDLPGGLPYRPWLAAIVEERTANQAIDDPHIRCLPDNFLRAYGLPHMLKFVHTPDLLVVLNEMNAGYRQVFTDARPLPEDPSPSWQGYSSATWAGDTLVIDTIGLRDDTWIDWNGSVLTEAAKVREEITRPDFGHLEIRVTVDDPKAYTKPWTVTLAQRIVVDAELIDEICLENEQFVERMGLPY
ncbi:MAG: hypothetical protein JXB36_19145 [Gammaproteobacteria bacterium]|nr:hypothetical protein [Gammaproteobacteria bacterium]